MCLLCLQLGFSSRRIITLAPYLVYMLSCCRMVIAACNLGFSLLQALDLVACTVLFKMSIGFCSNFVLFATPWRRMNEWKCSYTLLKPWHWMWVSDELLSHFTLLYFHIRSPKEPPGFHWIGASGSPVSGLGAVVKKRIFDSARNRVQFLRLGAMFSVCLPSIAWHVLGLLVCFYFLTTVILSFFLSCFLACFILHFGVWF